MEGGGIPTREEHNVLKCKNGGTLTLRRAKRSEQNMLFKEAGYVQGQDHTAAELGMLAFLWGVTAAAEIKDDKGNGAKFRLEPRGRLGKVCCEEVYNAVDTQDVTAVVGYVMSGEELSEAQRGN